MMTCDNDCTRAGWREALLFNDAGEDIHVSFPPETDLDDWFPAFSHDEQEMIRVFGPLIAEIEYL